jgi:hypothetical protein
VNCHNCNDTGWVCENHDDVSWDGDEHTCCGGAGMPCPECNASDRDHPPRNLPGSTLIWDVNNGWAN